MKLYEIMKKLKSDESVTKLAEIKLDFSTQLIWLKYKITFRKNSFIKIMKMIFNSIQTKVKKYIYIHITKRKQWIKKDKQHYDIKKFISDIICTTYSKYNAKRIYFHGNIVALAKWTDCREINAFNCTQLCNCNFFNYIESCSVC